MSQAVRLPSKAAGACKNTKQRLPFRIISKLPRRTFGHSLAIEANAWVWQTCSGVLAFFSAARADERKATAATDIAAIASGFSSVFIFASVDFSAPSLTWPFEGREWCRTSTGAGPSSLVSRYANLRGLVDQRQTFVHRCHRRKKPQPLTGRGKLAERIEVEFGPFRPAASGRAECFLVALPPVLGSSAPKICSFNQRSGVPWANSFLHSFLGRLPRRTE